MNKKPMLKCAVCGGTMEHKKINHTQPWGSEIFEFVDVPALVCRSCGEVWFSADVTDLMDKIIESKPRPKQYHKIPVFSLSEFSL